MCPNHFKYRLKFNANFCAFKDQESTVNDCRRLGWGSTGSSGVCDEPQRACTKGDSRHSASAEYCLWRCGNGDANSSDLSGEARNMDFHVKFPRFLNYCVCPQSVCCPFIIPRPQAFSMRSCWERPGFEQGLYQHCWLWHERREGKTALGQCGGSKRPFLTFI